MFKQITVLGITIDIYVHVDVSRCGDEWDDLCLWTGDGGLIHGWAGGLYCEYRNPQSMLDTLQIMQSPGTYTINPGRRFIKGNGDIQLYSGRYILRQGLSSVPDTWWLDQASWSVSARDPPIFYLPSTGTTMPSFLHGFFGLTSEPHAS